ncbi:hypothetical protein [Roseibium aggregatum]|uniref:hypothetical protein n=1 Tax=Roseibium aggregatum TaxID=187304 RepID=UPI001A8DAC8B|nr:hypothetical protein [Roseibium aggregatum]MBN8182011.1 hypothetical protein [Roseibium aggregatum]
MTELDLENLREANAREAHARQLRLALGVMSEEEFASVLGVSLRTFQTYKSKDKSRWPEPVNINGRSLYPMDTIKNWISGQIKSSL